MTYLGIARRTAVAALVSLVCGASLPAQDAAAKELMNLEVQWANAFAKHDAAAVGKLIADNFLSITDKGAPYTKAAMLKEIKADTSTIISAANSGMQVRTHGNAAVVIGIATITVKGAKGNVTTRTGWTDTWVKQPDGKWLCVASQTVPLK